MTSCLQLAVTMVDRYIVLIGVGGNNYPLKGGKITDWQGGVRVNAFVSGGYLPECMGDQKTEGSLQRCHPSS